MRRNHKDAPADRQKRSYQQRETTYEGSEKEEEVSRALSGFCTTAQKNSNLFFFTNCRLILASVYTQLKSRFGKTLTLAFIALAQSPRAG